LPRAQPVTAYLGLGSNLGDRMAYLTETVARLAGVPGVGVSLTSSVYETAPVGGTEQGDFLNMAAAVRTTLRPVALLERCKTIETDLGRVTAEPWAPRIIDLDILLYGDETVDSPQLTIPHPELVHRAFALVPLLEIAPHATLPCGTQLADALAALEPVTGVSRLGALTEA
jgi:2-amino-4-hydroxy-6-hydroxymethyldihydropteridine diphosphokinase